MFTYQQGGLHQEQTPAPQPLCVCVCVCVCVCARARECAHEINGQSVEVMTATVVPVLEI